MNYIVIATNSHTGHGTNLGAFRDQGTALKALEWMKSHHDKVMPGRNPYEYSIDAVDSFDDLEAFIQYHE